jgi:TolB protein
MSRRTASLLALSFVAGAALVARGAPAQPPPTNPNGPPPDESVLGTIEVNGSAANGGFGGPPPPKIGLVPLLSQGNDDAVTRLVVRRDMDLSGQYEVLEDAVAPAGPYTRTSPLDLKEWRKKEAEYVLRVYANPLQGKTELVGEIYETPPKEDPNKKPPPEDPTAPPPPPPKPSFTLKLDTAPPETVRAASHRLVDKLLGAMTGTAGSFASQMVYTGRVGRWRQVFVVDSDGFNLHEYGPSTGTSMSPHFGPYGEVYYALSADFHRYKIVYGRTAKETGVVAPGSIMSFAFSPNQQKIAYDVFENGDSKVYVKGVGEAAGHLVSSAPLANHPAFGPGDLFAYLGGKYAQRVYVNNRPISPAGFWSSTPILCDTPQGPKVIYTVGVGAGADLIVQNPDGSGIRRLTGNMGANHSPACSPDGRLVSFFSSQRGGKGPGLYIMPIARPWLAKKISNEPGEALEWAMITPTGAR